MILSHKSLLGSHHLLKWYLRRTLDNDLLCHRHRCDSIMVFNDLEGSCTGKGENARVMNRQHSVLQTLIVLEHPHLKAHCLAVDPKR